MIPSIADIAIRQNTIADAQRISTIQEDQFILGKSFSIRKIVVAPDSGYIDVLIDARECMCEQIVFTPLVFVASAGPIVVEIRAGVEVSALGTLLLAFNRRGTSNIKPDLKVYTGPTVTSAGVVFSEILLPGTVSGSKLQSSESSSGLPFEINKQVLYMARINNNDGDDIDVEVNTTWFEIG